MMRLLPVVLVLAVAVFALWVRLAPTDPARWHTDPLLGVTGANAHAARAADPRPPTQALAALDAVALATPRTARVAGSPEEGRITWVTRSQVWGFPDFTTAAAVPDGTGTSLAIFARARFGASDIGVNAARVTDWLARLAP
jgi:uncharacterized protein (DUF1499 family)